MLRERANAEAARGKFRVRAAWGDWKTGVPAGQVLVCGYRDDGAEAFFMVPDAEYQHTNRLILDVFPQTSVRP